MPYAIYLRLTLLAALFIVADVVASFFLSSESSTGKVILEHPEFDPVGNDSSLKNASACELPQVAATLASL
jgi:hypothetical protein